ncbi:MAG: winged helix-turn-helix transcriptional regulator [Candidatus Parvarchaeum sp.]|nr:winged helix-turn-helix transcriptional regulator [Candidatus Parvarchaeum tengchongense]
MNSLDEKYSKSVIFWLYENNPVLKTDLQRVVKNLYSLNSLLEKLEEDGLIQIEKKPFGKNITEISLTQKGREVAEHLMKLDAISKGKKLPSTERYAVILYLYRNGSKNLKEINEDLPGSTEILRELEKLNVVKQEIDKSKYPQETMLSLTEKGEKIGAKIEELEKVMEE